ncbi:MAG TPA: helix-turn-helix transcriptional regulator, partial [Leptolyngbyaceae cyanobacterium M65_K2018_010]|nr:helix-turn-helix transcriptional regulator [Leptolyngbyaceae cyanobacterium M65_K2018_010]
GGLVGQAAQVAHLGAFGDYLASSFTLYDLLLKIERSINTLNSGERVKLLWQPQGVWLQSDLYGVNAKTNPQGHFYSVMLHLNVLRMALGPSWTPPTIHLATAPCQALLSLKELAGVQIQFCQRYNAIQIANASLSLPLRSIHNGQPLQTPNHYKNLYQSAPAPTFLGSLHQLIGALVSQGHPEIEIAAAAAGISVRSLQRRLAAAGLGYSQLVEQVRLDLAMNWLQDPTLKLTDIAAELGYTHPSNFTRAFKRWTGLSPQQYRQHRILR